MDDVKQKKKNKDSDKKLYTPTSVTIKYSTREELSRCCL